MSKDYLTQQELDNTCRWDNDKRIYIDNDGSAKYNRDGELLIDAQQPDDFSDVKARITRSRDNSHYSGMGING